MAKTNRIKWLTRISLIVGAYMGLSFIARKETEPREIDEDNPYINICKGWKTQSQSIHTTYYEKTGKRIFDKVLSFCGLIILAPIYLIISIVIFLDDPGPVFFIQKRVGKDGRFMEIHKFRSMKMSTPHDVPTHKLKNPDQYITKVGKFLRKHSLDELPQIWDIFRGNMSIIGPRPALWNQEDLVVEREKYNANSIMPGLTGWAQINGRDELEISEKARLDGEYCYYLHKNTLSGMLIDIKCFLGTIKSLVDGKGVVEGGTGMVQEKDCK